MARMKPSAASDCAAVGDVGKYAASVCISVHECRPSSSRSGGHGGSTGVFSPCFGFFGALANIFFIASDLDAQAGSSHGGADGIF